MLCEFTTYERDENEYHTEDGDDCSSESSDESSDVEEVEWRREQKRKAHRCSSSKKSKEHWQGSALPNDLAMRIHVALKNY